MSNAITVRELSKSFRIRRARNGSVRARIHDLIAPRTEAVSAVDRVSFTIEKGERVAFIGPNGGGKSTTLKLLSGILYPDAGHAEVLGFVPWTQRKKLGFHLGTVFGQRSQLWYHLPARETFALLARVYEVDPALHRARLQLLAERFALGALLDRPVSQLSLGERMRAGSQRACCTRLRSYFWTSRPSASTWPRKRRSVRSCASNRSKTTRP